MPTHDLRTLPVNQHLRAFGCLLLGSLCAFQVSATTWEQAAANYDKAFNNAKMNEMLWRAEIGGNSAYSTSPKVGNVALTGTSVNNMVGRAKLVGTAGDRPLTIDVAAKFVPDKVSGALLNFAKKSLGPISIGIGLYDMVKELDGWQVANAPDGGVPEFKKYEDSVTQGIQYMTANVQGSLKPTRSDSCLRAGQILYGGSYTVSLNRVEQSGTSYTCHVNLSWPGGGTVSSPGGIGEVLTDIHTPVLNPKTPEQFLTELTAAQKAINNLTRVLQDAINSGELPDVETPQLTGPASTPGTTTTTQNPPVTTTEPDGSTTTKPGDTVSTTTTNHFTYQGNNITHNTTKVVNVTNNVTNTTTTTTSTTTNEAPEKDDKDFCETNPDSIVCQELDTPEGEIPKTTKTITYQAENLGFGGGSCPSDKTMMLGGQTIKVVDWADHCSKITTYAKPMILAMAMFAAMMIIFGGGGKIE